MTIDVAISSCARPDVLEPSVQSFLKHIVSEHDFRLVLVEDQVEDAKRQAIGHAWLEANKHLFDQLVYANKRLTYVYCFSEIMHYLSSPVFFRLEDDVLFTESLHIDPLIAHLEAQPALLDAFGTRVNRGKCLLQRHAARGADAFVLGMNHLELARDAADLAKATQLRAPR